MRNIVLIGFMGTGKTSVANAIAREYGYDAVDTDRLICEKEGMSINEIFAQKGEEGFRQIETALIRDDLVKMTGMVISCGGGMPLREENRRLLKQAGTVIWLKTSMPKLMERLQGDTTRPLLACPDPQARVRTLLKERAPLYSAAADREILTDEKTPAAIAREIIALLKKEESHD